MCDNLQALEASSGDDAFNALYRSASLLQGTLQASAALHGPTHTSRGSPVWACLWLDAALVAGGY